MIGFDLDGTLLLAEDGINYDDELSVAKLQPHQGAMYQARHIAAIEDVIVITGRGEATRRVTRNQVNWIFNDPAGSIPILMQQRWNGWDSLRDFKASMMNEYNVTLYIGDQAGDRAAARIAGARFIHAETFRNGEPIPKEYW